MLITQEDGTREEELGPGESHGDEKPGVQEETQPEISLNSVVGITSPKTFKLSGKSRRGSGGGND